MRKSLRLMGLHRDVNDAHRAGANRLQNKSNDHVPGSRETGETQCSCPLDT